MVKIGIIGGSGIKDHVLLKNSNVIEDDTKWGNPSHVEIGELNGIEVAGIIRHGKKHNIPPHKINHKANIQILKNLGVEKIIGVTSVGSLKKEYKLPILMVPHDYITLGNILTLFDDKVEHITPEISENLRLNIIDSAKKLNMKIIENGIYIQTQGPRLETKAEINMFKNYGDVMGMNMAIEATLSKELNIDYANISSIDNYANGIVDEKLTFEDILESARKNWSNVEKLLMKLVEVI